MTQTTPTCLWNDSAALAEMEYSIGHGAVGATCSPVIVLDVLKQEMHLWKGRIIELIRARPTATEEQIAWALVEEISATRAALLKHIFGSIAESVGKAGLFLRGICHRLGGRRFRTAMQR
jgi:transaldolase